jgi:UDP-glucose 4-epimerase
LKKYLVTGGAGFIGSHLVDRLLALGNEVVVIDDFSSGTKKNLAHQKGNSHLKIVNKSICDKNISVLFKNIDAVFHVAAVPRVQYSIKFPEKSNKANIEGTLNVLEAARKAGVKRFIYSASSSAYGEQKSLPLRETMTPNPLSPYALQKFTGEQYCKLYHLINGLETISLRYFNVYGPRQDFDSGYSCLIPKSINHVLSGTRPEIFGDGKHTRDFTYVKDIVQANVLAATTKNKKAFGEVFNVGFGRNISVNDVMKTIIGSRKIKPVYKASVMEPKDTLADNKKIRTLLGWAPKYTFETGIKETIEWFEKN